MDEVSEATVEPEHAPDLSGVGAQPEIDDLLSIPMESGLFNLPERLMTASSDESELIPWAFISGDLAAIILEMNVEGQLAKYGDLDVDEFEAKLYMLSVAVDGRGREDAKSAASSMGQAAVAANAGGGGGLSRFFNRNRGV